MKIADIKRGKFYRTTQGTGKALTVGGTRPPSVMIEITKPIPRGMNDRLSQLIGYAPENPVGE